MKKTYIEHQKIYPLNILMGGKYLTAYKPNESAKTIDLYNAVRDAVQGFDIQWEQLVGTETPLEYITSIIAENYTDALTELARSNFLTNPSFANDAEGWDRSEQDVREEKAIVMPHDNKNRLHLSGNGRISQSNDLIRKPSKHLEFTYGEEEEEEEGSSAGAQATAVSQSDGIVVKDIEWTEIEQPQQTEGSEEKDDTVYLSFTYICTGSGNISVGFEGSDQSSEDSLKTQTVAMEESEEIQTVTAQGTWDGTGDFAISLDGGSAVILSVSVTDKPLEEYRKQVDSCLKQVNENITKAYEAIVQILQRLVEIQTEINVLYNNDAILDGLVNDLEERVEELAQVVESHGTRLDAVEKKADTAYEWAAENWYEIQYTLKPDISTLFATTSTHAENISSLTTALTSAVSSITALQTSLATVTTSLTSLEERVKKLEGS